jgi:hypothetical protein
LSNRLKKSDRGLGVPPRLNEDVEYDADLIHGPPKIVLHTLDTNEYLVEVPFVPGPWPAAAQAAGKALAKFPTPTPHRFVGDDDAPLGQQELNVAQAEAEYMVQPDALADDLRGEAMAVMWIGWWLHAANLARLRPARQMGLP